MDRKINEKIKSGNSHTVILIRYIYSLKLEVTNELFNHEYIRTYIHIFIINIHIYIYVRVSANMCVQGQIVRFHGKRYIIVLKFC